MNEAGELPLSQRVIAADARRNIKEIGYGLRVLERIGFLRRERGNRRLRQPDRWRVNLAALDWTAIRTRVNAHILAKRVGSEPVGKPEPAPQMTLGSGWLNRPARAVIRSAEPTTEGHDVPEESPSLRDVRARAEQVAPTPRRPSTPEDQPGGCSKGATTEPPVDSGTASRRTEEITTTTTRGRARRPAATVLQIGFAEDLGLNIAGKDVVTLGDEIETAVAARNASRSAAKKATATTTRPAAGRPTTLERRRILENQRFGPPTPQTDREPETPEQATDRHRRAMENALEKGWRQDPDDPNLLVHQHGRRVRYKPPDRE